MKLELVSFALCPYVHRTTTLLAEKRVAFDVRYVDLANKPDWFLAISPRGKVPVLVADGTPLFESAIINEFLDETQLPRMLPDDPIERARQRGWIEVANDLFMAQYKVLSAPTKDEFDKALPQLATTLARFEEAIREPFFAGTSFGLVDAAAAPALYRFAVLEQGSTLRFLDGFPKVSAWAHRLATRPSVANGVPSDFDAKYVGALRQRGAYFAREMLHAA